ncbi:MAG: hydrogenase iron-sulfur subunit [Thermodesulfobacteriota bacterium]|nr:hydrogenase iron-sulfur subunit [Thermodesulfobacteriota bacterium]
MKQSIKVLAFLCNWAPWSCYTGMGDQGISIPGEVNIIRVMCASRVNISLLLKTFEKGADGVLIVGCRADNCQNGTGTEMAERNIEHTHNLLKLLGMKRERLQFKYYLAHESEKLSLDLHQFVKQIKRIGKSPILKN